MDPLAKAITEAVDAAIEARMPRLIAAIKETSSAPAEPLKNERFIPMRELEQHFLRAHRATIERRSHQGIYPPLRSRVGALAFFNPISKQSSQNPKTNSLSVLLHRQARGREK